MNRFLKRAVMASVVACLGASAMSAMAGEAEVRKGVEAVMGDPSAIVSVRKVNYGKFYEVVVTNGDILYADESGSYLIAGQLIDLKARKNITAARMEELSKISFSDLPLDQAVKQVRGNGKRILATFEDPNCGYCKKLAKDLKDLKDATIYTFLIPILSPDSDTKAKAIWCAPDRAKAWSDWMVDGKQPSVANCDNPIAKNSEMARKYRINGTPTMFLADGSRIGGYVALADIDAAMTKAEAARLRK